MTSCPVWVKLVCQMKNHLKAPRRRPPRHRSSQFLRTRRVSPRQRLRLLSSLRFRRRYIYKLRVRLPSGQEGIAWTDQTNTWRVAGDKDGRFAQILASRAESYIRTFGLPAQPTTDASQYADAIILALPGSRILSGPTLRLRKNVKY